jgi:hypothetical protein
MLVVVGAFCHQTEGDTLLQYLTGISENLIVAGEVVTAVADAVDRAYAQEIKSLGLSLLLKDIGTRQEGYRPGMDEQDEQSVHEGVLVTGG